MSIIYPSGSCSELTPSKDVPTLVPMEDISSLDAGQTTKRILQVRFHHHLLPLKLVLWCNGKKYPVKLWPDIGYFVKPLPMDIQLFTSKESQLPGMFEYIRRSVTIIIVSFCLSKMLPSISLLIFCYFQFYLGR